MRKAIGVLVALIVALPMWTYATPVVVTAVVLQQGCANTPTNQWAQARTSLTAAQNSVVMVHRMGMISDEQLVKADVAVQAVRAVLAELEMTLPEGGITFEQNMAMVDRVINRLIELATAGDLQF